MSDRNWHGARSDEDALRRQRYAPSTGVVARAPEPCRGGQVCHREVSYRGMYGSASAAPPGSESTRRLLQQQQQLLEQCQSNKNKNKTASDVERKEREAGYYQARGEPSREYATTSASRDYGAPATAQPYHSIPGRTSSHSLSSSSKSSLHGTDYVYDDSAYASPSSQDYGGGRHYDHSGDPTLSSSCSLEYSATSRTTSSSASTTRRQPYSSYSSQTSGAFANMYPERTMQSIPEPPSPYEHPSYQRQHSLLQPQHREQPPRNLTSSNTSAATVAASAVARIPKRLPSQHMIYHRDSSLRRLMTRTASSKSVCSTGSVYSEHASVNSSQSSVNDQKVPAGAIAAAAAPAASRSSYESNSGSKSYHGNNSNKNYYNNGKRGISNYGYNKNNNNNMHYGHDYRESSYSYGNQNSTGSNKFIEVMPGYKVPLRGANETWQCVENDFFLPTSCMACSADICCIQDAEYVICPTCKVVSPLLSSMGGGGGEDNNNNRGRAFGAGLGFTLDDLAQWQSEIMRQRARAH